MLAEVQLPLEDSELDMRQYDEERQEVGGFGGAHGKVRIIQQINHDGEVNRARWVPGVGKGANRPRWLALCGSVGSARCVYAGHG